MQRHGREVDANNAPQVPSLACSLTRGETSQAKITKALSLGEECGAGTIVVARDNDVLCGRGIPFHQHIGNIRWRRIITANRDSYYQCKSNSHKLFMALSIVLAVERIGGRFLRRQDGKDTNLLLIEINRKHAVKKTMQALREQPRRKRRSGTNMMRSSANAAQGSSDKDLNQDNHQDDVDNSDEYSQSSNSDSHEEDDVLPINHRAATQPLAGFSGLMSSFCSIFDDAPPVPVEASRPSGIILKGIFYDATCPSRDMGPSGP